MQAVDGIVMGFYIFSGRKSRPICKNEKSQLDDELGSNPRHLVCEYRVKYTALPPHKNISRKYILIFNSKWKSIHFVKNREFVMIFRYSISEIVNIPCLNMEDYSTFS